MTRGLTHLETCIVDVALEDYIESADDENAELARSARDKLRRILVDGGERHG